MRDDSRKKEFLYFMHHKDMEEAHSASVIAIGSQQRRALKPKPGKDLHLRNGVLLIAANREIPGQGNVFSGKEIQ
jgi:hypothetical protein